MKYINKIILLLLAFSLAFTLFSCKDNSDATNENNQNINTDTDKENTNTESGDTEGGDTEGGDTESGDTEGGDTEGGDTEGGDTEGGDTEGGDTEGGDTEGGDTEGGDTEGGDTEGGDTEGGDTEGGDTEGGDNPPASKKFTVKFDAAGGSAVSDATIDEGDKLSLPTATKNGYKLDGWYNGDYKWSFENDTVSSEITLTARWIAIEYSIEYALDGGNFSVNVVNSYTVESNDITIPNPQKEGCEFLGWTSQTITTPTKNLIITSGSMGALNLTANWKSADSYTITLNLEGGRIIGNVPTEYTVQQTPVTINTPVKDGYEFVGWIKENGETTYFAVVHQGDYGNKTFTAVWSPINYSITVDLANGTLDEKIPESYTIESDTVTFPTPKRVGYKFTGWTSTEIYVPENELFSIPKGSIGNIRVTANWSPEEYSIELILDGGYIVENYPNSYTIESENITIPDPAKQGCKFIGWIDDEGNTVEKAIIPLGSMGNKTFTATWETVIADEEDGKEDGKEDEESTLAFTLLNNGTYGVSGRGSYVGNTLVIPETYKGIAVTSILRDAFISDGAYTLVIPKSITTIEISAFVNCRRLVEVINYSDIQLTLGIGAAWTALEIHSESKSKIVTLNDYLFYTVNGTNYLVGYIGKDTDLTLPESYNGEIYEIPDYAFWNYSQTYGLDITSITIPGKIPTIGNYAFYQNEKLRAVNMTGEVNEIGNSAFAFCYDLISVRMPDGLRSYNMDMFTRCNRLVELRNGNEYMAQLGNNIKIMHNGESLIVKQNDFYFITIDQTSYLVAYYGNDKNITLPESYNGGSYEILNYAFYKNSTIESVTMPNGVSALGRYAFSECSSLTEINLPNVITSIPDYCFNKCHSLENVNIPEATTEIGTYAFYECYKIYKIALPENLTAIGKCAFQNCYKLTEIINNSSHLTILPHGNSSHGYISQFAKIVHTGNSIIVNQNGYLFLTTEENEHFLIGYVGEQTDLFFPEGYNGESYSIIDYAFYENKTITSVVIPSNVSIVGKNAFALCTALRSAVINSETVGERAFYNTCIESVTIGSNVMIMGAEIFAWCEELTSVYIADGIDGISKGCFAYCVSLESIYLPDTAIVIREEAFYECTSLSKINFPSSIIRIFEDAFCCTALTEINLNDGLQYIGPYAFESTLIEALVIPDTVTYIGEGAFGYCENLKTVKIGASVTQIIDYAFEGCCSLREITLNSVLQKIGDYAFDCCCSLKKIVIPASVTKMGEDVFCDCELTVYCEASEIPQTWDEYWNDSEQEVVLGYNAN